MSTRFVKVLKPNRKGMDHYLPATLKAPSVRETICRACEHLEIGSKFEELCAIHRDWGCLFKARRADVVCARWPV